MSVIGENIRRLRNQHSLTQNQLAKALKTYPSKVGSWEEGRGTPKPEMTQRIADYFKIEVRELLSKKLDVEDSKLSVVQEANHNVLSRISQNNGSQPMNLQTCMEALGFARETISTYKLLVKEKDDMIAMLRGDKD